MDKNDLVNNNFQEHVQEKRKSNNPNGGPIRVAWRFDSDGNLIIKNPTFSDYFKHNYTNKYGCQTVCELCGRNTIVQHKRRHQSSKICNKMRRNAEQLI